MSLLTSHMPSLRELFGILKKAAVDLKNNDPLRMAAATAFFTTFALPAILIIFIQIFGLVVDPESFSDHLFEHLGSILGNSSADQIKQTLMGFRRLASNVFIGIGGFIFLVFVATTLFKVIRDSLNQLWNIKVYSGTGVKFKLQARIRAMLIIMISGLLFLTTILGEAVQALLLDYIKEIWAGSTSLLYALINQFISIMVVTIWFTLIFRLLANGRPVWKVAFSGGLFTGVLFTIGKLLLAWMLGFSNIDTIYGASGSIVLILLFVFYSSFILYFGATFTYAWAEYVNRPIVPKKHAYSYELSEIKT
jgi:membrane protein